MLVEFVEEAIEGGMAKAKEVWAGLPREAVGAALTALVDEVLPELAQPRRTHVGIVRVLRFLKECSGSEFAHGRLAGAGVAERVFLAHGANAFGFGKFLLGRERVRLGPGSALRDTSGAEVVGA